MTESTVPSILALHSSGASGRQWRAYQEVMEVEGFGRWATPHLLGYGPGASFEAGQRVSLDDEVDAVLAQLPAGNSPLHLIGHSYGGATALQFALRFPERVRSLTLYEPVRFAALRLAGQEALWQAVQTMATEVREAVESGDCLAASARFCGYWAEGDGQGQPSDRAVQSMVARMPKVVADFGALFADRAQLTDLAALEMPVRLLCGGRSPAPVRKVAQVLAEALPNAVLVQLPRAHHLSPLQWEPGLAAELTAAVRRARRPSFSAA